MDLKGKEEGRKFYLAISDEEYKNRRRIINETFKGEVSDVNIKFPKGIGAAHPFNFDQVDKILSNIGIADAMADKIVDAIVGDFVIKIKDPNSQKILDSFVDESNLKSKLKPWIKGGVTKGNGFMELDLKDVKNIQRVRVMKPNDMYVRRNKKGKVLGYRQWKGQIKLFSAKQEPIPLKPDEIAHITINKIPNDPYGRGLLWSNRVTIEHYAGAELDYHKLLSRKAGAPLHIKLGQPGEKVRSGDLDDFKGKVQYMTNSTEWVTDANTEIKVIDFAGVGDNLLKASEHDVEQLSIGMKIPMSLVGVANNPEGLANVNQKGFDRFIHSVRVRVEEVIETQILRPILRSNSPKLDGKIEFIWDLPDVEAKNERLSKITETLKLFDLSPELRAALEIEYAEIAELDVVNLLPTPEQTRKEADKEKKELERENRQREEEETKIKQPEVPGVKPTAKEKAKVKITESEAELTNMNVSKYVNIKEIPGFNYSDYLVRILRNLKTEKFEELLALTEKDLKLGLLPKKDIKKLRIILKNGFRKNKTIRQIEKDISQSIDLKDRVKIEDGVEKVTLSKKLRPNAIARTETVRLANQGLKDIYIENDVRTYRYLAAIDDRTSDICMSLDGQVFLTKEGVAGVNMPPMHVNCRSSIVGLVD